MVDKLATSTASLTTTTSQKNESQTIEQTLQPQAGWYHTCRILIFLLQVTGFEVAGPRFQAGESIREMLEAICLDDTFDGSTYPKSNQPKGWDKRKVEKYINYFSNEIKKYFINTANEINIPIFMQDVFDTPISPEMAVELSNEHQNLKYLKVEVAPTLPRFNKLNEISNNSLPIPFGGMGGIFMIEEMRRGSVGTMPVCAIPEMFVKAYDLWDQGKHNEAEEYFHKYVPLIRTLGQGLGIWNWLPKYILKKKGIFSNAIAREPSLKPDNEQIYELDRMFDRLDL